MSNITPPLSPFIKGPAGALEILTEGFDKPFKGIVIICHPHPLHGGTMTNKVVHYIARAMQELGFATLRFNFRGVGKSEGKYGDGIGETDDLLAIIDWASQRFSSATIWLAGFSFGSYVSLRASTQRDITQLITIAPAVNLLDFKKLILPSCPWLLIQGDEDEIVPFENVTDWVNTLETRPKTIYLNGVGHFFHGQLVRLRQTLLDNLIPAAQLLTETNR